MLSIVIVRFFLYIFFTAQFSSTISSAPRIRTPKATQKRTVSQKEYDKAILAFYAGEIEKSITIHEQNIQKDPLFFKSYFESISLYREISHNNDALRIAKKLYQLHPPSNTVTELYFITLVQANKLEEARQIEHKLSKSFLSIEAIFYKGFLAYRLEEHSKAILLFQNVLNKDSHFAAAAFFMGLSYQKNQEHLNAIEAFNKALKIEPNFSSALYPLALSQIEIKELQLAFNNLQRAHNLMPKSQRINQKIKEIEMSLPKIKEKDATEQKKESQKATYMPIVKTFSPVHSVNIRIGLIENARQFQIKTSGSYSFQTQSGSILYGSEDRGSIFTIISKYNSIEIYDNNGNIIVKSEKPIILSYKDNTSTTAIFDLISSAGYYFANTQTRYYRGNIEFIPKNDSKMTLVNELNLEEYLYSVVPSEMPAYWPEEALKAQAIAARTYALATMGSYKGRGFDLLGSIASQAYTGIANEHDRTTKAVNDTANIVLYSKITDNLLVTYFSANHGGYAEAGDVIWQHAIPNEHLAVSDLKENNKRKEPLALHQLTQWIKSRPKTHSSWPGYHSSFAFRSSVWIDNEDLKIRITHNEDVENIQRIITRGRGISGRVTRVDVITSNAGVLSAKERLRSQLGGLRSNLFSLETIYTSNIHPQYFIFFTAGWGHGVGLDQSGAAGMASDGYTWQQIIKHYYPNSQAKNYDSENSSNKT